MYCRRRCIGGGPIETDKFCLQERPMNKVFDGRPALFDMFNILVGPTDETERQMFRRPTEWRRFHFVGDQTVDTVDQTLFVVLSFLKLLLVRGTGS